MANPITPPTTPPAIAPMFDEEGFVVAEGLGGVPVIAPAGIEVDEVVEMLLDEVEVVDMMVVFAGS